MLVSKPIASLWSPAFGRDQDIPPARAGQCGGERSVGSDSGRRHQYLLMFNCRRAVWSGLGESASRQACASKQWDALAGRCMGGFNKSASGGPSLTKSRIARPCSRSSRPTTRSRSASAAALPPTASASSATSMPATPSATAPRSRSKTRWSSAWIGAGALPAVTSSTSVTPCTRMYPSRTTTPSWTPSGITSGWSGWPAEASAPHAARRWR